MRRHIPFDPGAYQELLEDLHTASNSLSVMVYNHFDMNMPISFEACFNAAVYMVNEIVSYRDNTGVGHSGT